MEKYNDKEFSDKIKKSIQILMYLWEVKGDRTMRPKASNINHFLWDAGASVAFNLEFRFNVEDPDVGSFHHTLDKVDDKIQDFFGRIRLLPDADDLTGLFIGVDFKWESHEDTNNTVVRYSFDYSLFYDEYEKYFG